MIPILMTNSPDATRAAGSRDKKIPDGLWGGSRPPSSLRLTPEDHCGQSQDAGKPEHDWHVDVDLIGDDGEVDGEDGEEDGVEDEPRHDHRPDSQEVAHQINLHLTGDLVVSTLLPEQSQLLQLVEVILSQGRVGEAESSLDLPHPRFPLLQGVDVDPESV